MAGLTQATAEARLADWLAADEAVAGNQSYRIRDAQGAERELTRADAAEIRRNIDYWQGWVTKLASTASGRSRTRYVVPG